MLIAVFIQRKPMKQGGKQASVCITASVKSEKSKVWWSLVLSGVDAV